MSSCFASIQYRETRNVNEERELVERLRRVDQPRKVSVLIQSSRSHVPCVDPTLSAEKTSSELFPPHLQGEDADAAAMMCSVEGDVEGEGCLPHRRPCGENHQIRLVKTRENLVEINEPGGNARDFTRPLLRPSLDLHEGAVDHRRELLPVLLGPLLGDIKDRLLGKV